MMTPALLQSALQVLHLQQPQQHGPQVDPQEQSHLDLALKPAA